MAIDNTEASPGEAGTPEGFAEVKANLLSLTPLEVLKCLQKLSTYDQDKVMRTLQRQRGLPDELAKAQAQIAQMVEQLEHINTRAVADLRSLEQHTPDSIYITTNANIAQTQWQIANQHQLGAYEHAQSGQFMREADIPNGVVMTEREATLRALLEDKKEMHRAKTGE